MCLNKESFRAKRVQPSKLTHIFYYKVFYKRNNGYISPIVQNKVEYKLGEIQLAKGNATRINTGFHMFPLEVHAKCYKASVIGYGGVICQVKGELPVAKGYTRIWDNNIQAVTLLETWVFRKMTIIKEIGS